MYSYAGKQEVTVVASGGEREAGATCVHTDCSKGAFHRPLKDFNWVNNMPRPRPLKAGEPEESLCTFMLSRAKNTHARRLPL